MKYHHYRLTVPRIAFVRYLWVLLAIVAALSTLAFLATPAAAIVHAVTPVEVCANSVNAGGVPAVGKGIDPGGASNVNGPVPVTPASGVGISSGEGGDSAPVQC